MMEDVRESFVKKGLEFVSITESTDNPDKSILTYKDGSGGVVTRLVDIRLDNLEEAVEAVYNVDSDDLAAFLMGESKPILEATPTVKTA